MDMFGVLRAAAFPTAMPRVPALACSRTLRGRTPAGDALPPTVGALGLANNAFQRLGCSTNAAYFLAFVLLPP